MYCVKVYDRGRFEGACHHVFQSIQEPLEAVLTSAKLSPSEIDKVVLVGGVCKIQYLQQLLREWLPSSEILSSVSPEHVVAMGGAIQGDYHIRYLESIGNVPCSMSCTSQDIWIHVRINVLLYICMLLLSCSSNSNNYNEFCFLSSALIVLIQ